nr:1-acyl-sn-glycerol-3-phosphate acyltransferase [Acidimicrobiia bacterium]
AERTFRLDVVAVDGRNEGPAPGRPAIVACRHAGPGDSMLLVDGLVNDHRRRPRIVLKDLLQLDPCFDVMLNRVPTVFVPSSGPERDQVEAAIARLASDLGPEDALVIFPEGTNATASRKRRIIHRFRRAGRHDLATKADALAHTLPPRTSGLFAAIDAAPHADVVFMVHTGLEHLNSLGDVWRGLPMDSRVLLGWWRVDAADVPGDHADRERWLYDEWQRLDDWVAQRQG